MSRDQRPARVRVFSSGGPPEGGDAKENAPHPLRRRGDLKRKAETSAAGGDPSAADATTGTASAAPGGRWIYSVLFLIGCVAGGILLSLSGVLGEGQ